MFAVLRQNPLALTLAVLLHLGLLAFLVIGVDWQEKPKALPANAQVVQARVVDQAAVEAERNKLREAERQRQAAAAAEEARLKALQKRRAEERERLAELERQRKAREAQEAKRRAEAERQAAADAKRRAELKARQEEAERRQAEERARQAELERQRQEAAAAKKRAEEEQARREAEIARQREAERKAAEAERRRQEAAAKAKAEAAAREAELRAMQEAEQVATEASRIQYLIEQKVTRRWNPPPGTATAGLQCRVEVRLGSSGTVLAVSITQSSGNAAFDRSVEAAVWKADPLPMPDDPALRERSAFRNHVFTFDPAKGTN